MTQPQACKICEVIITVSACLEVSGQSNICFPPVSDSVHAGLLNPEHQASRRIAYFLEGSIRNVLFLTLKFSFRCCLCLSTTQPSAQWPRSVNAGYSQAASGEGLPAPRPAPSPPWWLDKGWRCPSDVADEAARRSAGGRGPESWDHGGGHFPISHDVCWANWGRSFLRFALQQCWNHSY